MSKKRDFTLYQRVRIFLYRYNTFWLELGIQLVGGVIFVVGLVLLPLIFGEEAISRCIVSWTLILTFFVWGFVGWVRIIKGERSTKLEIVRSKYAVYSGIVVVLVFWGTALTFFIIFFFAE